MSRWTALLRRMDRAVMDMLYPKGVRCVLCGHPSHGQSLCEDCRQSLEMWRLEEPVCPHCGREMGDQAACSFCAGETLPFREMASVWRHVDTPRNLVLLLKHDGIEEAADVMAPYLAERARSLPLPPDAVVTWVTMPETRRRSRGIDHGRLLAEKTAALLGLPVRPLLIRVTSPKTQQGLDRAARLINLEGSFACEGVEGLSVLLVDDVTTTGATGCSCASCLMAGGAAGVWMITATQAVR